MRDILFVLPVLLAACAAAPAPSNDGIPVRGSVPGAKCDPNADVARFIGQPHSDALEADILKATGSADLRVVDPDTMVTMEYNESRVTVHLDTANKVTRIVCG